MLGTLYIAIGASVALTPPPTGYPLLAIATEARAAGWITTGLIAVICAHKPQGRDAAGFAALYLMAAYRVIAYGQAVLMDILGLGQSGALATIGMLAWVIVLALLRITSGWPEHPDDTIHTGPIPTVEREGGV